VRGFGGRWSEHSQLAREFRQSMHTTLGRIGSGIAVGEMCAGGGGFSRTLPERDNLGVRHSQESCIHLLILIGKGLEGYLHFTALAHGEAPNCTKTQFIRPLFAH